MPECKVDQHRRHPDRHRGPVDILSIRPQLTAPTAATKISQGEDRKEGRKKEEGRRKEKRKVGRGKAWVGGRGKGKGEGVGGLKCQREDMFSASSRAGWLSRTSGERGVIRYFPHGSTTMEFTLSSRPHSRTRRQSAAKNEPRLLNTVPHRFSAGLGLNAPYCCTLRNMLAPVLLERGGERPAASIYFSSFVVHGS